MKIRTKLQASENLQQALVDRKVVLISKRNIWKEGRTLRKGRREWRLKAPINENLRELLSRSEFLLKARKRIAFVLASEREMFFEANARFAFAREVNQRIKTRRQRRFCPGTKSL